MRSFIRGITVYIDIFMYRKCNEIYYLSLFRFSNFAFTIFLKLFCKGNAGMKTFGRKPTQLIRFENTEQPRHKLKATILQV